VRELLTRNFPEKGAIKIIYDEKSAATLDTELVEALASGIGPDMLLLPPELLVRLRGKLTPIPYANYTERQYKDTFIAGADVFLQPDGIYALPVSVDPLLMYWNRDALDEAGIATPPKYWDEFLLLATRITRRDRVGNISRAAVSLGEYRNVAGAKEIIAALLLQAGNPIIASSGGGFTPTLAEQGAESVINFYTEFANPIKPVYSWNRSMPDSRQAFLSERLAIYFGFGSELAELRRSNANLNFDVSPFPAPRNATLSITYGKMLGAAILRRTPYFPQAYQVALTLSGQEAVAELAAALKTPPVRRDLLAGRPGDANGAILYDSALRARAFADPNPSSSGAVFQNMIESITGGRARTSEALQRANGELGSLIR
jgi:multiple sugar transport system substrate-binding protein